MEINQDTSDGYHTFRELYNHRRVLTKCLFNADSSNSWKSMLHDDGTMFDDYFIVGIVTSEGQATYHYHMDYWGDFNGIEIKNAPPWDGHTPEDAISRIEKHFKNKRVK